MNLFFFVCAFIATQSSCVYAADEMPRVMSNISFLEMAVELEEANRDMPDFRVHLYALAEQPETQLVIKELESLRASNQSLQKLFIDEHITSNFDKEIASIEDIAYAAFNSNISFLSNYAKNSEQVSAAQTGRGYVTLAARIRLINEDMNLRKRHVLALTVDTLTRDGAAEKVKTAADLDGILANGGEEALSKLIYFDHVIGRVTADYGIKVEEVANSPQEDKSIFEALRDKMRAVGRAVASLGHDSDDDEYTSDDVPLSEYDVHYLRDSYKNLEYSVQSFVRSRLVAQRAQGELLPVSWIISHGINDLESRIAFAQYCIDQGNVK